MLSKDTEDCLISRGLKNALCNIRAADLTDDIHGLLNPCTILPLYDLWMKVSILLLALPLLTYISLSYF